MISTFQITTQEFSSEHIEQQKLFHIFVIGLPRSGCLLMSRICEQLGVHMFNLSNPLYPRNNRNNPNKRVNRLINITYEENTEQFFKMAAHPYSGTAMAIPLNRYQCDFITMLPSKVIFMERDLNEIKQSTFTFKGKSTTIPYLKNILAHTEIMLKSISCEVLNVDYQDVLNNPETAIKRVKDFIKSDCDTSAAVEIVKPSAKPLFPSKVKLSEKEF